jgi:membrane protein YdbS with pleckstrin-like domain
MALISCPECGKQVSSQAATCPSCGIALGTSASAVGGPRLGAPAAAPSLVEQTLWEANPSGLLLLGQAVGVALVVLVLVVLAAFVFPVLSDVGRSTWFDASKAWSVLAVVLGAYVLLRGIRIALHAARLRSTRYRLTNQRLVVETGLVTRTLLEVDLRSVDDLVFRQGLMERLLGIGTISVVSSDHNAPRLGLLGVKDPRAIRELIRTQAYALTQRQLFTRST